MRQLPAPLYVTRYGKAYLGDALQLLDCLPDHSVDLVITSPPFALQRKKEYGNRDQDEYVDWLLEFAVRVKQVLKDNGSFVLDLGGAYRKGRPVRSLYNYRVLVRLCDELDWNLAEEFFWFNPAKLPSPIEWVNKRKIRAKDAVNTVWWLSKTDFPEADVSRVLVPYSERMKLLLQKSDKYYSPKKRPSGHNISERFAEDKGGAIPSNLLQIPNTESNSQYLRCCKIVGAKGHPARFPQKLPEFFIKFLTDPGDTVLDIFAGSNTTGAAAECLGRQWIAFELEQKYLATSAFRFLPEANEGLVISIYDRLCVEGAAGVEIPQVLQERLFDERMEYVTEGEVAYSSDTTSTSAISVTLVHETERMLDLKSRLTDQLAEFEERYGLKSADFYGRYEEGEMGDEMDFIEWSTTVEMLANVEKQLALLERKLARF